MGAGGSGGGGISSVFPQLLPEALTCRTDPGFALQTVFSSEAPSGQNSVGTDTSHGGDSTQHPAPLSVPATLPGDTPITPTPEQVNKPESEPRGSGRAPLTMEITVLTAAPPGTYHSSCFKEEA